MKVLVLYGTSNKGKTKTLNLLIDELTEPGRKNVKEEIKHGKDRCCVFEYNDKILKITTRGDDECSLKSDYNKFPEYKDKTDIFICAARSKGETHNYIRSLATDENIYWLSKTTFFNKDKVNTKKVEDYRNLQNETQAKEMVNIIKDFLL